MKNQATEILVGLWKKETEDQTIVRFKLPDKNDLEVLSLEVRLAEIAGSERERAAYVYAECRDKHGMRKAISSEVGRFTYLGKTEYALGWCTKTTVMSAGRCNIQSIGKYDGSDFKTGTEHNRMILYFEVK